MSNRQALYSLLADEALEAVRELEHCHRDNRKDEQRQRLAVLARALHALDKLKEVV